MSLSGKKPSKKIDSILVKLTKSSSDILGNVSIGKKTKFINDAILNYSKRKNIFDQYSSYDNNSEKMIYSTNTEREKSQRNLNTKPINVVQFVDTNNESKKEVTSINKTDNDDNNQIDDDNVVVENGY